MEDNSYTRSLDYGSSELSRSWRKGISREKVDKLLSGTAIFLFPAVVIGFRQGPARDIFWRRRTSRSVPMARTCLHDKLQERGGGHDALLQKSYDDTVHADCTRLSNLTNKLRDVVCCLRKLPTEQNQKS